MGTKQLFLAGVLATIAIGLVACGQTNKGHNAAEHFRQSAREFSQGARDVATQITGTASDAVLTARVKARLAANQGLSSFSIHVGTENGVVTLTGKVTSVAAKQLAAKVTSTTEGVRIVVNNLKVSGMGNS